MTTPSRNTATATPTHGVRGRLPLQIQLHDVADQSGTDGVWRPQSRSLHIEAADLVDNLPAVVGRINRLLFSRPDWDDALENGGRGARRVMTGRGWVKMGSFPSDDTQLMILAMASGRRLRLAVVHLDSDASSPAAGREGNDVWDDEQPST